MFLETRDVCGLRKHCRRWLRGGEGVGRGVGGGALHA